MSGPSHEYGYGPDHPREPDGIHPPSDGEGFGSYGPTDGDTSEGGRRGFGQSYGRSYGAPDGGEQPTCPRHPDRVAYVRCKNCGRPACPECQRPAAVGTLCADCEREVSRRQRNAAPRTAMGGRTGRGVPYVTYTVIGLCLALFIGQTVAPAVVTQLLVFAPFRALAMPWTFMTSGFLHGGILHIALNMYAMWLVGQYLERTMGHWRFAAVYLVSILAGSTAVLVLASPADPAWATATLGASGGVFGLFGSLFIVNRRMGAGSAQILLLIGLNLVITFTIPNISWQGHLGGLVVGTAMTAAMFALRPTARPGSDREALARRSGVIHVAVVAAAIALCLAAVVVKVLLTPSGAFIGWG
ncbi:MAG: rhomboid family intramembrane serine protease [Brachybacterium sp.]|nr:rhomboid family intramembrane serine protease [Brachybacterium sp.]